MIFEEALKLIQKNLYLKTGKELTTPEKEILKAAWYDESYAVIADKLYLSVGHIKDVSSRLWRILSDCLGEKVTKKTVRMLIEQLHGDSEDILKKFYYHNELEEKKYNILIVDDTKENIILLSDILGARGYKTRKAINGKMALKSVRFEPPDIILLDIRMPDIDGYKVCEELKKDEQTSDIPIIFLSSLDDTFDKVRAFQVGGIDYITKPFKEEELLIRVENQLIIKKQKLELQEKIEQLRQIEETLYQSRAFLANIIDNSVDGIMVMQSIRDLSSGEINDFRGLLVNPVMANILGKKRKDLIGKINAESLFQKLSPNLFEYLVKVVETEETLEMQITESHHKVSRQYHGIFVKLGDGISMTIRNIN